MKRKIISWVLTLCLIVTLMPLAGVKASAATDKASALVTNALRYNGKSLSGVKTAMKKDNYSLWKSNYGDAWCAWYVSQCARNVGAASLIPANTYVFYLAKNVAGAGGKITCIDRAYYNKQRTEYGVNRTFYDAAYKPRKGDLVIFAEGTATKHIGIVTANSSNPKSISTVEGNSGGGNGRVVYYSSRSYSSGGQHIAAYVTPNYTNTYYLAYSDGIASTKNDSSIIPTQTMKRGVSTKTTTKKFTRSGYTYSQWYILKYDADGYANYWCRDKATGKKAAWYRYDKIPSTYSKVKISHGGKIYFNVATQSTIYLTPVWVKSSSSTVKKDETYYLAYSDGLSSTKNDSSIIPTGVMKRGVSSQTTTKKFTRTGYDYTHWYIFKKDANGYANYWCRDKATGKKAAWYRYDKIPSTYYKVTFPHGGKIYFTVAANTTLYLTPVWVKKNTAGTSTKANQTISGSGSFTKAYGSKAFALNAAAKGKLTYKTSNSNVATVNSNGTVTIKGTGKATITITAAATSAYNQATKKVTVTVTPKKVSSVKVTAGTKKMTVSWSKDSKATGYQIFYAKNSKFTSGKKITVSKNSTVKKTISKLTAGSTYYVKVRAYKTVNKTKIYGSYSSVKKVTVLPKKVTYSWPIVNHKNKITGKWGLEAGHKSKYHYGIDIAASKGTKVLAAADGTVIHAGLYYGYGYCVQIKHSNGCVTLYGHNSGLNVKKGAKVKRGAVIAYVGGTGSNGKVVYGNHCHFGIYKSQSAVGKEGRPASEISYNPLLYLK